MLAAKTLAMLSPPKIEATTTVVAVWNDAGRMVEEVYITSCLKASMDGTFGTTLLQRQAIDIATLRGLGPLESLFLERGEDGPRQAQQAGVDRLRFDGDDRLVVFAGRGGVLAGPLGIRATERHPTERVVWISTPVAIAALVVEGSRVASEGRRLLEDRLLSTRVKQDRLFTCAIITLPPFCCCSATRTSFLKYYSSINLNI